MSRLHQLPPFPVVADIISSIDHHFIPHYDSYNEPDFISGKSSMTPYRAHYKHSYAFLSVGVLASMMEALKKVGLRMWIATEHQGVFIDLFFDEENNQA